MEAAILGRRDAHVRPRDTEHIVPLHEQHRPKLIFMNDNAPDNQSQTIREQMLETGELQIKWQFLQTSVPLKPMGSAVSLCRDL